jgi:hypothetical protein
MNLLKLSVIILFYFLSRVALAVPCEEFHGYKLKEKLCFDKTIKGWISEKCLKSKKCEAKNFFKKKKKEKVTLHPFNGQNPAALYCHFLKLNVIVLKDTNKNEQSFCRFKDESLVDANAVERFYQ